MSTRRFASFHINSTSRQKLHSKLHLHARSTCFSKSLGYILVCNCLVKVRNRVGCADCDTCERRIQPTGQTRETGELPCRSMRCPDSGLVQCTGRHTGNTKCHVVPSARIVSFANLGFRPGADAAPCAEGNHAAWRQEPKRRLGQGRRRGPHFLSEAAHTRPRKRVHTETPNTHSGTQQHHTRGERSLLGISLRLAHPLSTSLFPPPPPIVSFNHVLGLCESTPFSVSVHISFRCFPSSHNPSHFLSHHPTAQ